MGKRKGCSFGANLSSPAKVRENPEGKPSDGCKGVDLKVLGWDSNYPETKGRVRMNSFKMFKLTFAPRSQTLLTWTTLPRPTESFLTIWNVSPR
jgi:hypothetical protein